jgi:regulator of replication initiation timing
LLDINKHEEQISELSKLLTVDGIDTAKVSTILQGLRENYTEVSTSIEDFGKKVTYFEAERKALVNANANLITKLGAQEDNFNKGNKEDKPKDDKPKDDVMSLEDIAKKMME